MNRKTPLRPKHPLTRRLRKDRRKWLPGADVGASFFDDAVFIGDSISLRLTTYCQAHPDALGKAQFLTAGSLGSGNALWDENSKDAVFPLYNGKQVTLQDGVAPRAAQKKCLSCWG